MKYNKKTIKRNKKKKRKVIIKLLCFLRATLMSQGLTDLDISHKEFKTIVNEKEKYDQIKGSVRNKKDQEDFSENGSNFIKKIFFLYIL